MKKIDEALIKTMSAFMNSHDIINSDDMTIILKGHLIVEHLLNQILENKFKPSKNIVNFRFKSKMEILYSSGFLPEHLYKNSILLNSIRNEYAHNLDYDLTKTKLTLIGVNGNSFELEGEPFKNVKNRAHSLCGCILTQLSEFISDKLGIVPEF